MQINIQTFYIVDPAQFIVARKLLQLRQVDVATSVGLTPINYSKIERNKTDPKLSTYSTIVEYFIQKGISFHTDGNVSLVKHAL